MAKKISRLAAVLGCILIAAACGYGFKPGGEYIDRGIQTVFVDVFVNKTSEANIENTFRGAFIDQFIQGKRFRIVDSADRADAVFRGSIDNLTTGTLSYKTTNLAAEERYTVTLTLSFDERLGNKVIWSYPNLSSIQDYKTSTSTAETQTSRNAALTKLANDTAERAYRLLMSGF